ncbi:hypothetical protein Pelo_9454 [Pelomyxa schiedti]|nr:hypothetical protein Pelo_9454 [Pelomyxa schiedti]
MQGPGKGGTDQCNDEGDYVCYTLDDNTHSDDCEYAAAVGEECPSRSPSQSPSPHAAARHDLRMQSTAARRQQQSPDEADFVGVLGEGCGAGGYLHDLRKVIPPMLLAAGAELAPHPHRGTCAKPSCGSGGGHDAAEGDNKNNEEKENAGMSGSGGYGNGDGDGDVRGGIGEALDMLEDRKNYWCEMRKVFERNHNANFAV